MIGFFTMSAESSVLAIAPAMELGRGAIAGAFIVAVAFLAGYAAIRRSGLAVCALFMVLGAAALELFWLGFFPALPNEAVILTLGLFAAAAIIFLSATIGAAKYNPLLGGVMFTAALVIAGIGFINLFDRIELTALMRWSVIGVGGFAGVLALTQALRGDAGARLIVPGVLLAIAAPLVGPLGVIDASAVNLAPHGLFTLGILATSLVALMEGSASQQIGLPAGAVSEAFSATDQAMENSTYNKSPNANERIEVVLDSQLARVLDYSGVAIWDWSSTSIDQTESLPSLLGADSTAPFTPEALHNFIHKEDAARFESEILTPTDGPFDVALKLFDGRKVRFRGARAANEDTGELERLVAFIETASPIFTPSKNNGVDGKKLQKATEAAIVPAVVGPLSKKLSEALENGDIVAAFQPIVELKSGNVVGYEALARWRDQKDGADEGPETFVRAAEDAGKGGALAKTMLDQAASFLVEKNKTEGRDDLFVAMNVSWGQMREKGFSDVVRDTIKKYKLSEQALILELTEGDAVSNPQAAGKIFRSLKKAGAALAFDDFGAGFSCLSNLSKYDFDYLKIDKSFAQDLESDNDDAKIVGSLARLGRDLGLKVIVEGVESKSAAEAAAKLGCAYAQGYALGRPSEITEKGNKTVQKYQSKKEKNAKEKHLELTADMVDEAESQDEKKPPRWAMWRRNGLR